MGEALAIEIETPEYPDISHIITEDDTPVDNIFSEKQQRLLAESLNGSWNPGHPFIAASNVGIFYAIHQPPVVPDMFLSMDVQLPENIWEKRNRSYFVWEYGKPPEVVVEVVSNTKGREVQQKFAKYLQMGVWYYIVFDPQKVIQHDVLRIYELSPGQYIPKIDRYLSKVGLGINVWEGVYENRHDLWLRWYDSEKKLILTGVERAKTAEEHAENAEKRAETAETRAENAEKRAERLAEKLRAIGIDPNGTET